MELEDSLGAMQRCVGGTIEAVYEPGGRDAALICNDEGKLLGLPLNRALRDEEGEIYDVVAGQRELYFPDRRAGGLLAEALCQAGVLCSGKWQDNLCTGGGTWYIKRRQARNAVQHSSPVLFFSQGI